MRLKRDLRITEKYTLKYTVMTMNSCIPPMIWTTEVSRKKCPLISRGQDYVKIYATTSDEWGLLVGFPKTELMFKNVEFK